jgi:hypothetical protein
MRTGPGVDSMNLFIDYVIYELKANKGPNKIAKQTYINNSRNLILSVGFGEFQDKKFVRKLYIPLKCDSYNRLQLGQQTNWLRNPLSQ